MSRQERDQLFSDPPEHQSSDSLDNIGLESSGRLRSSRRRAGSERTSVSRRGSQRSSSLAAMRSQREKKDWARERLKKLVPLAIVAAVVAVALAAFLIHGRIRASRLARLGSGDSLVREEAAINLGELESASGLDRLLGVVRTGEFEGAGGAAALALSIAGEPGLERLEVAAGIDKPQARSSAAYGLGLTREDRAVAVLAKLLADDDDSGVRIQAAKALGIIKSPGAVAALVAQAEAQKEVREAVLQGVLTAACPQAKDRLVAGLGARTAEMRRACALALIATERLPTDPELKALAGSGTPEVRAGAVQFLALVGGELFEEVVLKALADDSAVVRAAAASAAGLRRWEEAAEPLEKMLTSESEEPKVKHTVAEALGRIRRLGSVVALARALANPKLPEPARLVAAESLSTIGRKHRFSTLISGDKKEFKDHITHVKLTLKTPDPRWEALGVLVKACDSFSKTLAPAAFGTMRELAGRKLAPKPDVWKAWMDNKLEEGKILGHIAHLVAQAYALKKQGGDQESEGRKLLEKAREMTVDLLDKCDPADKPFFDQLDKDLCMPLGIRRKKKKEKKD